jgi:hypothetical protein
VIIYHQNNIAAFAGAHIWYSPVQSVLVQRITETSAAAAVTIVAQARSAHRFIMARVHGRVN